MDIAFIIIQLTTAVLLVITIILQQKGAGLGAAFGGGGENVYATKRGAEKFLFQATIVLSVIFLGTAIARLFIP